MEYIVAELLPVLTLIAPTAMVLLTVRYLNLRDARRGSANMVFDDHARRGQYRL
jgi:hypothetical protein